MRVPDHLRSGKEEFCTTSKFQVEGHPPPEGVEGGFFVSIKLSISTSPEKKKTPEFDVEPGAIVEKPEFDVEPGAIAKNTRI